MTRRITPTYVLLNQITLAANSVEVVFSGLPQNYADLVMVGNWSNSGIGSAGRLQLNADAGANYNGTWIVATGSGSPAAGSESGATSARIAGASIGPSNTFSNVVTLQFMDYSASDKHKTILTRYGAASTDVQATAVRWANNAPVTSIRFFDILGQTFQAGATFSIYGIAG
jgi:hypothetical protein